MSDLDLSHRIRTELADPLVEERPVLGGDGFFIDGKLIVGVIEDALWLKDGESKDPDVLGRPEAQPYVFAGRPVAGWILVDSSDLSDEDLKFWLEMAKGAMNDLPG